MPISYSMKIIYLILALLSYSSFASSVQEHALKKITLMKYVTEEEAKYGLDFKLTSFHFNFIEEAYAYSEGSACLILGFQSTFKNGMCRLSKAEGAKELLSQCSKGSLPCNPEIFGNSSKGPFCVPQYGGAELSRHCSHASIKNLKESPEYKNFSDKTKSILKEVASTSPKDFSFGQVKDLSKDANVSKAFISNFKTGLEESKKFTEGLCQAIKQAPNKSKIHEMDIKNCQAQLDLLNEVNVSETKLIEVKKDQIKEVSPQKTEEIKKIQTVVGNEEQCLPPPAEVIEPSKISTIKKVPEMLEAKAWNDCVTELYNHKSVPVEARGNYYHNIAGEKYFGKQCWDLDKHGQKEVIYSFVSDTGFKVMKFPVYYYQENGSEASLPRNIFKFKANGKSYLLSQYDHVGEYFDSLPEENLTSFAKEQALMDSTTKMKTKYIDGYEARLKKDGKETVKFSDVEEGGMNLADAQSCLKARLSDYISIILYKTKPEAIPYYNTLNADLKRTDRRAPDLQAKYGKTIEEIKKAAREEVLPEGSACKNILTDKDLDAAFDENYSSRYENYEQVRKYFVP